MNPTQPPSNNMVPDLNMKAILARIFGEAEAQAMTAPPLTPQQEMLRKIFQGVKPNGTV
jgi:hypothetical protein